MPNPPPIILDVDAKQPGQQNDDVAASDWSPRSTGSEEQASVEAMVAEVYVSIDRAMHDRQKTKTFKLFLVRLLLEHTVLSHSHSFRFCVRQFLYTGFLLPSIWSLCSELFNPAVVPPIVIPMSPRSVQLE